MELVTGLCLSISLAFDRGPRILESMENPIVFERRLLRRAAP